MSEGVSKVLSNGELVIRTDEGIYFHALNYKAMPILIDKEEGERLMREGA